jgi:hypothetical protein
MKSLSTCRDSSSIPGSLRPRRLHLGVRAIADVLPRGRTSPSWASWSCPETPPSTCCAQVVQSVPPVDRMTGVARTGRPMSVLEVYAALSTVIKPYLGPAGLALSNDRARVLVIAQTDELGMAQMGIRRPLNELKLSDQHRFQPPTVSHFVGGQSGAPATALLLR